MRHDRLTGKAAEQRPFVNELGKSYAPTDLHHDSTGIRRRERRAMNRFADRLKRHPRYAEARQMMDALKAEQ